MRKKLLLGATNEKEIVFAEIELTHRNGYPEFTASFDTVRPFKETDYNLEDFFEEYNDPRVMGAEWVLEQCKLHNCSPQNLPYELAMECYDIRDAIDCSLFPECYEVCDDYGYKQNWYFESSSCGQHDTRKNMSEYVDKGAYNTIHSLWDLYHLKEVNEEKCIERIEEVERLLNVDWEEWISDYIRREVA